MRTTTLCVIHNKHERASRYYRICFECGHMYRHAADIVNENAALIQSLNKEFDPEWYGDDYKAMIPEVDVDKIYSCPFCMHDF